MLEKDGREKNSVSITTQETELVKGIALAQHTLGEAQLDGWLIHDYRHNNSPANHFLGIPRKAHLTRRLFYWIPVNGQPVLIASHLDAHELAFLPGERHLYTGWRELQQALKLILSGRQQIAMEYSPQGTLPALSIVDAGIVEFVRGMGVEVVSSGELLATVTPPQTDLLQATHRRACGQAVEVLDAVWDWICQHVHSEEGPTEWEVQEFILDEFASRKLITEGRPICAVNLHAANPHHTSLREGKRMRPRDWVLLDLWCREEEGIYADLTQVGVLAPAPTERQGHLFDLVREARDAALGLIEKRFSNGIRVEGWEVDAACRAIFRRAGLEEQFIHRTGHDISQQPHGSGTHLDDFESHDTRPLRLGSCFSVEPGLYFPGEFGIRLECDVLILPDGTVEVTGSPQRSIRVLK